MERAQQDAVRSVRRFRQVACRKHGKELNLFTMLKRRLRTGLTAAFS